ncbi:hypothetical protein [Poseidonocella sp. HB161398]|uniref:hypothetical protein n=1 Tax=Poseidonocella sp. HB161398 TaxID=2320855 RepID=UPI001107C59B|nr:hypothetical protein [Poseidonocella sp. HB161398]
MKSAALAGMAVIGLASCIAHSPPLHGARPVRIASGGSVFLVRHTDTRAEATRISAEAHPDRMTILARALAAIEAASGCKVLPGTLYGDWTLAEAYLDCPGGVPQTIQPVLTHRPAIARPPG